VASDATKTTACAVAVAVQTRAERNVCGIVDAVVVAVLSRSRDGKEARHWDNHPNRRGEKRMLSHDAASFLLAACWA
jgi:hypothetical protein